MKKLWLVVLALCCVFALTVTAAEKEKNHLRARLVGINETPQTVITNATGSWTATLNNDSTITFTLTYKNLSTPAVQAHIHVGATKTTGGVAIFFCGPAGCAIERKAMPGRQGRNRRSAGAFPSPSANR